MKVYTKNFTNEETAVYQLEYTLLIHSGEQGRIYGIEIEKIDTCGNVEKEQVLGLCESREDAEQFLARLAEGLALPVELTALCDDFVFERESKEDQMTAQVAS